MSETSVCRRCQERRCYMKQDMCRECYTAYRSSYYSRPEIIINRRVSRGATPFPLLKFKNDAARFASLVDTSGECWLFKGSIKNDGYGALWTGYGTRLGGRRRKTIASRFAWILWRGPIPDGLYVCHRCDNPPCVRPSHLFLGTARENLQDAISKNRIDWSTHGSPGTRNPKAKLTEDQVREIRRRRAAGEKLRVLSEAFGVSMTVINHIEKRKLWRCVA